MNSRERFESTMKHENPDRVPIDIGGTSLTGMRPRCHAGLQRLLGFSQDPRENEKEVDERILQWAGADFR